MSDFDYQRSYRKFWMGFEVSTTKLRVFRFTFFAVFAIDAWLQISHAPRYGANNFNVGHFPWLDFILPNPTRPMMVAVFGLQAYLGVRLAFGAVSRAAYLALAALFAFGYYISQLNSLQHHYLLSMALCLIAFFPWPDLRRPGAVSASELTPGEVNERRQSNWPVRMLLVSLSIMYFFAVITKLDPLWLDGSTLKMEVSSSWTRGLCDAVGWSTVAVLTLVVELALAVLLHVRRLWPIALVLGIGMHMSFEHSGLEIGLFSYFMVTLYFLVLPESWLAKLRDRPAAIFDALAAAIDKEDRRRVVPWLLFASAIAAGVAILQLLPLESMTTLVVGIALTALADFAIRRRGVRAAISHLIAVLSLVCLLYTTNTIRDYYRFWGGQERRTGNFSAAIIAYEDLVRFEPGYASGHRRLGDLYRQVERTQDAIEQYETGLGFAPDDFELNKSAAQLYHLEGRGAEALRCAERASATNNKDQAVRRIREHWRKRQGNDAKTP